MFGNKNNKEKEGKKNTVLSKILKVLKWICIVIVSLILLLLIVRAIGKAINNKTPDGGISESMYVDINGTKQWISIYGQDLNNPVILYLHGGPGEATSYIDYAFLRKWSDIYTVVSWDQRDAGLSKKKMSKNDISYTHELFMQDGLEMTKYLLNHLHKEKIILIGHSWGSSFGSNLSLKYPEYYQYYIGTGQLIDMKQNEAAFVEAAKIWSKGDKEGEELVAKLDVNNRNLDYYLIRQKVMERYGFHGLAESPDYNIFTTLFFNPYYSILDLLKLLFSSQNGLSKYMDFLSSPEFDNFSLLNRTEFPIPYYNINGDHDYQTNYIQAQDYFNIVKTPRKKLYMMKDMNHGLLEVRSGEFSNIMHEIAKLEQNANTNSTTTNV